MSKTREKGGVVVTAVSEVGSIVDRLPENTIIRPDDTEAMTRLAAEQRVAELRAISIECDATAVAAAPRILGAAKLRVVFQVAALGFDALKASKDVVDAEALRDGATSRWIPADVDAWAYNYAINVRISYPELVRPERAESGDAAAKARKKSDNQVRVMDWIGVQQTMELMAPLVPGVDLLDCLAWTFVRDRLMPLVRFDKRDLTTTFRSSDWTNFLQIELPRLASRKIDAGQFIAAMAAHEVALETAKLAEQNKGKTAAAIAAEEQKIKLRKEAAARAKLMADTNSTLATVMSVALSGVLPDEMIVAIIRDAENVVGRALFPAAIFKPNPDTFDADDFKSLIRGMSASGRDDAIDRVLRQAKITHASMNAAFATEPKLSVAS